MKNLKIALICLGFTCTSISPCSAQTAYELLLKGNQLFLEQNFREALNVYQLAISLDPMNPVMYLKRGLTFRELGEFERFLQDIEKAQKLSPDVIRTYREQKHYFPDPEIWKQDEIAQEQRWDTSLPRVEKASWQKSDK